MGHSLRNIIGWIATVTKIHWRLVMSCNCSELKIKHLHLFPLHRRKRNRSFIPYIKLSIVQIKTECWNRQFRYCFDKYSHFEVDACSLLGKQTNRKWRGPVFTVSPAVGFSNVQHKTQMTYKQFTINGVFTGVQAAVPCSVLIGQTQDSLARSL